MDEAFIIMQIGNPQLDSVCDQAIVPAIRVAGFAARRVDRHNQGDLLKSEIVQFIERSQIIIADLTNERPNCYLEIGYAMGLGKKANLILTAREDHHHSSPNYNRGGPKIHFDLEGYDILFWDSANLNAFKDELTRRISRRAAIVGTGGEPAAQAVDAPAWWMALRSRGEDGLHAIDRSGYMEVAAQISPAGNWTQARLLSAARDSVVHTFGWPIAVNLDNRDEDRPRPTSDGIEAEISIPTGHVSYDLWKLFRDGRFYTLLSLFEDELKPNHVFWDSRIHRVAEALFFLARLYRRLEASDTDRITVDLRHSGLSNRTLGVANQLRMTHPRTTTEEAVESSVTATLVDLENHLAGYVKQLVEPLFVVFDFFEISDEILAQLVDGLIKGEIR